ncbi:HIT family protein [Microbulbifer agarilyticus]|uniref:HIT family protein n=1 Tax=Microbulbifer agarilyticus TaxID=260552 RepID=A0A1Q2M400_9GAMM|nr:HIT family protein [Microbulbifer agarilyticus]AQQ67379.1 HIT family protein [Microbulbifer agarilyticus]
MASIFTQIINGDLPGHFVWRDDSVVAFMTIAPIKPGHCLVVPVAEIDHWDDVPAETSAHLMDVASKVAKAQKQVYRPRRVGVMVAGIEVPHTHYHLVPINEIADLDFALQQQAEPEALAEEAAKIRQALADLGFENGME